MSETLLERLKRKLTEAGAEVWEHTNTQDVALDDDTSFDAAAGTLSGGLSFRVKDRAGAWHVIHHERMESLKDSVALDNVLARGFSIFLMKHPTWPK